MKKTVIKTVLSVHDRNVFWHLLLLLPPSQVSHLGITHAQVFKGEGCDRALPGYCVSQREAQLGMGCKN